MALTSTIYTLGIDLSDTDRHVYERLDLRLARHPSESAKYFVARVLAYCLEYRDGIAMTDGLSDGDQPAVVVRDLTGRVTGWIDVGMPDAARLHRASKLADHVAVYTHRDVKQLLAQLAGQKIHRATEIPIHTFDREFIKELAGVLERRMDLALSIADRDLFVALGERTLHAGVGTHQITTLGP